MTIAEQILATALGQFIAVAIFAIILKITKNI